MSHPPFPPAFPAPPCWRLEGGRALAVRELDGSWLVYDRGSGATHLFNELAVVLWHGLEAGPVPEERLLAASLARLGLEQDEDGREAARAALARFRELGLASTVPAGKEGKR